MKHLRKLVLSFVSVIIMVTSLGATALATEFTDTDNHWAVKAINTWSDYSVIQGYEGKFRPDEPITRGEMARVLNNVIGYQKTVANPFKDINNLDWFYNDVIKLNAAGVMLGSYGEARPDDYILREEAVVMIARAFNIEGNDGSSTFADAATISAWANSLVNGMQAKGYVQGSDNKFNPQSNITRAEVITILNNMTSLFIKDAGEYTANANGSLIVRTAGVTLKGMTVSGDLYLMEGIGEGNITLDGITVKGNTFIRGGGKNSIIIKGGAGFGNIYIYKDGDAVRIVNENGEPIPYIQIGNGTDVILSGSFNEIYVGDGAKAVLSGNSEKVNIAANAKMTFDSGAAEIVNDRQRSNTVG